MLKRYVITPVDPIISRDARPFGVGGRVRSLSWLTQSVIAGAIRTHLYSADTSRTPEMLKSVAVRGAFPVIGGQICFPRPLDILKHGTEIYTIRPIDIPAGCGVDMPNASLLPCAPRETEDDFKPDKLEEFWTREIMVKWLNIGCDADLAGFSLDSGTHPSIQRDERIHASIDPKSGTTGGDREGRLFSTIGLDFNIKKDGSGEITERFDVISMSVDIELPDGMSLPDDFIAPIGGERRLAAFKAVGDDFMSPDNAVKTVGSNIRMVLASPAIFSKGWLPGWIDDKTMHGVIPDTGTEVRLVSAVTERWQPVSGWSYEDGSRGPKPLRRAVPAGSVYFFEYTGGSELDVSSAWLRSVCDDGQDRRDGCGLALWGTWSTEKAGK